MKRLVTNISPVVHLAIILAVVVVTALVISMGCSDRLKGDVDTNQKPYVNFVNVPPDLQRFSRNPIINWYGSDVDGIIAYFRYVVVLRSDIGVIDPVTYVLDTSKVSSSAWTHLTVNPTAADPKTSQIVKMSADMSDPIRQYIEQYVFLQAVDAEGASSDVVYRLFSRNDHPPQTMIFGYSPSDTPFVNSVFPSGQISGVRIRWTGSDLIDYPQDPPPFDYHWRLYGPYTDSQFNIIATKHFRKVLLTREALVYDSGVLLEKFDTTFYGPDSFTVKYDSVTVRPSNASRIATIFGADFGVFEPHFAIEDTAFTNPVNDLNRIVDSSLGAIDEWVRNTDDTLFNVFKDAQADTTQQLRFILWARSRDDAGVPDPIPAYLQNGIGVVDPKFERHVLIIDYTNQTGAGKLNAVDATQSSAFWLKYIHNWETATGLDTQFTVATDVVKPAQLGLIKRLLQHRVVILFNDHAIKSNIWEQAATYGPVLKAISGGVNCWLQMRCSVLGQLNGVPSYAPVPPLSFLYSAFFGVESPSGREHIYNSGWSWYANGGGTGDTVRNESFKGARSLPEMEEMWPPLFIDTALLHANYNWSFLQSINSTTGDTIKAPFRWVSEMAALPEVNPTPRLTPGTDPMYFFYSMYNNGVALGDSTNGKIYGGSHPNGPDYNHSFYPVAHQFNSGFYKTVHMDFTLPAIKRDANLDVAFNRIMDYLWDGGLGMATEGKRYPDSKANWSREDFQNAWKLVQDRWNADAGWTPEDALK
ncbi:MAG: hypothetical protein AAB305_03040 [Candidatus Zixiibacteriota bacterium]